MNAVPSHRQSSSAPLTAPRREETTRPSHLRVAPRPAGRRRARVAVWVTALVTAVALFALVAFHVLAVQHAFELDRLDAQRNAEELRYERLRSEVATLSAPESVVDAARALGMLPASDVDYIEAEAAAPSETAPDATSSTLVEVYGEAKRSLDP